MVPRRFERAYEALEDLVDRVSAGEVREEVLGEEVDGWRRDGCGGGQTLAKAAVLAYTDELSRTGLAGDNEAIGLMPALRTVDAVLDPPYDEVDASPEPVEVALPKALRRRMPQGRGFVMGELQIIFEPAEGGAHLSVSHPRRYPTWEEIRRASTAPGGPPPNLWVWVPKAGDAPGIQRYVVHLYVVPSEELFG